MRTNAPRALVWLALAQGIYFVATGVWPLAHMDSFLWATGPKTDLWLVRTVAVLVLAIGAVLLFAAWRLRVGAEVALLAVATGLGLAAIEIVHVLGGTIRPIYLGDAVAEIALAVAWMAAVWAGRDEASLWGRNLRRGGARRV